MTGIQPCVNVSETNGFFLLTIANNGNIRINKTITKI